MNLNIPQVTSTLIQENLRKQLVALNYVSQDWAGELAQFGDTVKITKLGLLTAVDSSGGTYTATDNTGTQSSLVLNQTRTVTFLDNDVHRYLSNIDTINAYAKNAAYAHGLAVDTYVASLHTGATAGTITKTLATDSVDDIIIEVRKQAAKADVPMDRVFLVLPPDAIAKFQTEIKTSAASSVQESQLSGFVMRRFGVDIYESNNLPGTTTKTSLWGMKGAIAYGGKVMPTRIVPVTNSTKTEVASTQIFGAVVIEPAALGKLVLTI